MSGAYGDVLLWGAVALVAALGWAAWWVGGGARQEAEAEVLRLRRRAAREREDDDESGPKSGVRRTAGTRRAPAPSLSGDASGRRR